MRMILLSAVAAIGVSAAAGAAGAADAERGAVLFTPPWLWLHRVPPAGAP